MTHRETPVLLHSSTTIFFSVMYCTVAVWMHDCLKLIWCDLKMGVCPEKVKACRVEVETQQEKESKPTPSPFLNTFPFLVGRPHNRRESNTGILMQAPLSLRFFSYAAICLKCCTLDTLSVDCLWACERQGSLNVFYYSCWVFFIHPSGGLHVCASCRHQTTHRGLLEDGLKICLKRKKSRHTVKH